MTTQEIKDQEINEQNEATQQQQETVEEQQGTDNMTEESDTNSAEGDTMTDGGAEAAAEATPKLTEENIDWKDRYIRLQAEFDNYRKRTLKEKMDLIQSGGSDVIKAFLPVVDDMQRAEVAMQKSDDIEALRNGVAMISQKMGETLKQRGVVEIEAVGLPLDTDLHEAVARFAAGEDKRDTIIDVVQSGYKMGEKVIRFAKVVVGE
ncbi:MAG: nucleotide exchange factor GrpE [Rikenellaceae bacterium]